ncbi:MAG: 50S ribosomal protein L10 [Actinomycetota bacterium]|nr:50S ribosomal protein L10 [Actinomycetota bacterium]
MPRPEKVQAVAEIKERIEGSQAVFLAEYAGLSVKNQQQLRRELRAQGAEFKVVKMTLARLAAAELEIDTLDELLIGPTGLAFSDGDPVSAAKALKDFAKEHEVFVIKGGLLGREFLTPETISQLADIEPRPVLLAKLAGAMKAPMANLAGLMAALPRNTASVFKQLLEKKELAEPEAVVEEEAPVVAEAEAPAAEPVDEVTDVATEEAPSEDASAEVVESDDVAEETTEDAEEVSDAVDEPEAAVEAPHQDADDSEETEDVSEAKVEASDDAEDKPDDQAEASDDAEEE